MKLTLTVLTLLGAPGFLSAQDDTLRSPARHRVSVVASPVLGYWKDVSFSPLNYRMEGAAYRLDYLGRNRSGTALFEASADVGFGSIAPVRTDLTFFTSDYIVGDLTLGYLKVLPQKTEKLRLSLGPQYHFNIGYFDYRSQDSFTFVASHTLNAAALLQYSPGSRHTISAKASVALAGLLIRPPYAGYDTPLLNNYENHPLRLVFEGGRFAALHNYQLARCGLDYRFGLTARMQLALRYGFSYQRVQGRYHPFVQAVNQLGGGVTFLL